MDLHGYHSRARGISRKIFELTLASLFFFGLQSEAALAEPCPCTLWPVPPTDLRAADDNSSVELGLKFRPDTSGVITGLWFHKSPDNTGTHIGNLWSLSGTRLATTTFTNESSSGWQYAAFQTPVPVAAGTTYIVSYFAPNGHYSATNNFFASSGVDTPPLHAERSSLVGGNGVYAYSAQSSFPSSSFADTNYWVDVVFDRNDTEPQPPAPGPVLVITSSTQPFSQYYAEILRAEGLNEFGEADILAVTPALLSERQVAVLGQMALTDAQVGMLRDWINAGGNLIAMRPDKKLAGLLGLNDAGGTVQNGYILAARTGAGRGIVKQTLQFHDAADRYTLNDATPVATLYTDSTSATPYPAISVRSVGGNGGHAAAFTYDLARSVVYTRQGNPALAGQETDGHPEAIRPDDLFFQGHLNLDKVAIPQADEQQRLLANLITQMNLAKTPLPRFWYLPRGLKAAIVHTLDDHNTSAGTRTTFQKLADSSTAGCSVENWECLRATAWTYADINLTDTEASSFVARGFEMGAHVQNGGRNFTSFQDLDATYAVQLATYRRTFPSVPAQTTHRYHAIIWSDWLTQARVGFNHGVRYNMDYYYWPGEWVAGRPGLFTGSGIPMRFADTDGATVDVYQGVSQLVNESLDPSQYSTFIGAVLDRALGQEGYYGLFGTHDDFQNSTFLDAVIGAAQSRNVPVITARQALTWLDGRNASRFSAHAFSGNQLRFTIAPGAGATGLQAMIPVNSLTHSISAITRNGASISFAVQAVKGMLYAFVPAIAGDYAATYNSTLIPEPEDPATETRSTLWPNTAVPSVAAFNDPSAIELGVKFKTDRPGKIVGIRFYKGPGNDGAHIGTLWSTSGVPLARVSFEAETATGWQQQLFAAPVEIAAGATYVASYHTDKGMYAVTNQGLATGRDSGPLHALANTDAGSPGNGVFAYGPGGFPTESFQATHYWVDVVFEADNP